MATDRGKVLEALKSQLTFLESGGYRRSPRTPWKVPLMFEDSPTCLNLNDSSRSQSCLNCPLMFFVTLKRRSEKVPCRYIALNAAGETVDGLYRYASQEELEQAVAEWLQGAIQKLEAELAREESVTRRRELTFGVLPNGNGETKSSN